MADTELKRTISSAGSQTKWGASAWVKLSGAGTIANTQAVYCSSKSDTTANLRGIMINSDYRLQVAFYDGGYSFQVETNRLLRDPSGFYHLCIEFDSSQSTANDRIKIWVNGVQETSMSTNSQPSHNGTYNFFGTDITQLVGSLREGSTICNPCIISHLHVTDGYCYPASTYGEIDATSGEWKIKVNPSVTYGTNGFFLLKDNASLTDQSTNSNDFTLGSGTLLKSEDNPSCNFATWNVLHNYFEGATYSCGNNKVVTGGNNTYTYNNSTLGMTKGKYYCEIKNITAASSDNLIGITDRFTTSATHELGNFNTQWAYRMGGGLYTNNTHTTGWGASWAVGDYIGIGLDLDNNKLYFSKNGTWQNPTAGISITDPASVTDGCYYFSFCGFSDQNEGCEANFGNGSFGTTQLTGTTYAGADGNGIFKYDPNNITLDGASKSFNSLSTKGLNA